MLVARRAHRVIRYDNGTMRGLAPMHLGACANPAMLAAMAKRKPSAPKAQRRPRAEIDRNYYFGDVLMRTGAAVAVALGLIALYTPFTIRDAITDGMYAYLTLMGVFAAIGIASYLTGYHLRREATQWDFD
jgi:hypothetical protein